MTIDKISIGNLRAIAWHFEQGEPTGGIPRYALVLFLRAIADDIEAVQVDIAEWREQYDICQRRACDAEARAEQAEAALDETRDHRARLARTIGKLKRTFSDMAFGEGFSGGKCWTEIEGAIRRKIDDGIRLGDERDDAIAALDEAHAALRQAREAFDAALAICNDIPHGEMLLYEEELAVAGTIGKISRAIDTIDAILKEHAE